MLIFENQLWVLYFHFDPVTAATVIRANRLAQAI